MTTLPPPPTSRQVALMKEAQRKAWAANNPIPTPREIHDDEYRTGLDGGYYDEEEREMRNI